jgi:CRISPR-associated protein Csx10
MRYRVYAEAETPAAISVRRATGNDLDTQRFIPGTVIRGALAAAYLEESGGPDAGFAALFLNRMVRYGDLRIGDARPWPLSTRQCSARPDEHAKIDNLLREGAGRASPRECPVVVGKDGEKVLRCKWKFEPPKGYYRYKQVDENSPFQYCREEVRSHRLAHSQIDPEFLKARPGQFHSSQLLEPKQTFQGFFHARDLGEETLKALISEGRTVHVGRGRSRGQGRVRLSIYQETGRSVERMIEKIRTLNEAASRFAEFQGKVVFSCTLDSATLVYDRWLLSRSFLDATDLLDEPTGYTLASSFRRVADLSGWHAKGGLPKAETKVIAAGSCFLFQRDAPANREVEYEKLARAFVNLEERGIGERLDEGLGEATFCRTLHSELAGDA